jgi:membrane protease YdiL (CAAX protease family)
MSDIAPESVEPTIIAAEIVEEPKKPWGAWMTLLMSVGVVAAFYAAQIGVGILTMIAVFAQGDAPAFGDREAVRKILESGWMLSLATWSALPFTFGSMWLFVRLRKGWSMAEYLGWNRVSLRQLAIWLPTIFAVSFGGSLLSYWNDSKVAEEFVKNVYATSYWPPLLWATLLIAAPLFEESFFRGFMFRGIQDSGWGNIWAVVITSVVWTAIHVQYDFVTLLQVFLLGLALGAARAITRSTTLTMIMHFLVNLLVVVELYWFL